MLCHCAGDECRQLFEDVDMAFGQAREPQYATQCRFLRITLGRGPSESLLNICQHIIREDSPCVGPFLDETETTCQLWELHPRFEGRQALGSSR